MRAVFNSLGSNYSAEFITLVKQLIISSHLDENAELVPTLLSTYFPGSRFLFYYKGRDAISAALRSIENKTNKQVFIQAFACYAVEEAVIRAGYTPVYVDIESDSLNLSVKTLQVRANQQGYPACIIIQHTLGYPADIKAIRKWCDIHNVLLIEDLAQAFGGKDDTGNYLGSRADIVVGSFGRDKIIDAVSGGFCAINPKIKVSSDKLDSIRSTKGISKIQIYKDLLYPLITDYFRRKYPSVFSKLILNVAKKTGIIITPLAAPKDERMLPIKHEVLALSHLYTIEAQLEKRKKFAKKYYDALKDLSSISMLVTVQQIKNGTNLRFPVYVDNPETLIAECKKENIFISDRWYRSPVDCSTLECTPVYQPRSCPNAEDISEHCLNLPTHQFVTIAHVEKIIEIIKKYS